MKNQQTKTSRIARLLAIIVASTMNVVGVQAANIIWSAPAKISSDTDVSLNGTLVRAINATPTNTTLAIDVTLNGVTFVAARKNGTGLYVAPGGDTFLPTDTSSVGPTSGGFQAFGQGGAPFNTLSAACSNLLCTAYWNDGTDIGSTWAATAGYDWTLNNLTVGKTYELQVWVNDSRLSNLGQNNPALFTSVMDTNGHSVNLEHNVDNLLGGVGQHVTGTFTADATSQTLKLVGGNTAGADTSGSTATSLLNAYQLRDISPAGTPRITEILLEGINLITRGTNGPANGAYEVLRSAGLSVPVGDWPGVGIHNFDASGNFSCTNPIAPDLALAFYRLRVVSSVPGFPPVITSQLQDAAILVGQNANFNVTASGTAPLTYRWYFNTNTLLTTSSSASLTITNAQITNSGKISVTVSNLVGVTNSVFAMLTVTGAPPVISVPPTNQAVMTGVNLAFAVTATGTAPLRYQWYYNTNTALPDETNSTLTLSNAQPGRSGTYSVTVTNLYGVTNSVFATLTVTNSTQPPLIVTQPASANVGVGQTAVFTAAADGALPLSYQWYFHTNTALTGQTNPTLTLTNVQPTNAGKYSVTITNLYGSTNSAFATLTVNQELLAFPEAEGYGKYTVGGRTGVVYEVTNLSDSGAGSLRAAVEASGPRTVVFRVSGTINLTKDLTISKPYITIAGQTAPGDGICLKKYTLNIDADQVIIRYIRARYGDELKDDADAVSMRYHKNIILDHVSASWGDDETLSLYHGENVTVQWCLISETLNRGGNHGFAGIWGSQYSTFHHNLVAHCVSRNMRFASGCGYTDYRNNVIYNWGYNSAYGGEAHQVDDSRNPPIEYSQVNMVNNYYKPGPATESDVRSRIVNPTYRTVKTDYGKFYVAGNHVVGNATVTADNWNGGVNPQGGSGDIPLVKLDDPWPAMAINQQSAQDAYTSVLAHVGCSKPVRDSVDTRIINEASNATATYGASGIIESQSEVGGWPTLNSGTAPTDTDHDGMPDAWETSHGLNLNNAADRNSYTLSPIYSNLEVYLNELGAF
jgi:hypothetical protein